MKKWSAGKCSRSPFDHAAHDVRGVGVHPEEGRSGRHTPFFKGYKPQFYFRTTDVTGEVTLPEGTEMVMPGDNITFVVTLGKTIACEEGSKFAIREGRTNRRRGRRDQDHRLALLLDCSSKGPGDVA